MVSVTKLVRSLCLKGCGSRTAAEQRLIYATFLFKPSFDDDAFSQALQAAGLSLLKHSVL